MADSAGWPDDTRCLSNASVTGTDAEHSSGERRKERHEGEALTFAGAFAAGPRAWALLLQKWLIFMRSDLKLQLVAVYTRVKEPHAFQ